MTLYNKIPIAAFVLVLVLAFLGGMALVLYFTHNGFSNIATKDQPNTSLPLYASIPVGTAPALAIMADTPGFTDLELSGNAKLNMVHVTDGSFIAKAFATAKVNGLSAEEFLADPLPGMLYEQTTHSKYRLPDQIWFRIESGVLYYEFQDIDPKTDHEKFSIYHREIVEMAVANIVRNYLKSYVEKNTIRQKNLDSWSEYLI